MLLPWMIQARKSLPDGSLGYIVVLLLLVRLKATFCETATPGCDPCTGPWILTFDPEKMVHALMERKKYADIYLFSVIKNVSLTEDERMMKTREMLSSHDNKEFSFLYDEYNLALKVQMYEMESHASRICTALGKFLCDTAYTPLKKIVHDTTLTKEEKCKQSKNFFETLTSTPRLLLCGLPRYGYYVERDQPLPTFKTAFDETYALGSLMDFKKQSLLSSIDHYERGFISISELNTNFAAWINKLLDRNEKMMASLQWGIFNVSDELRPAGGFFAHCEGIWMLPFNAQEAFAYFINSSSLAEDYFVEVAHNQSLLVWQRKTETRKFLHDRSFNSNATELYNTLDKIETFERTRYIAELKKRFYRIENADQYRNEWITLLDIAYNIHINHSQMCAGVHQQFSRIPQRLLDQISSQSFYSYTIKRDRPFPPFSAMFDTLAFRTLNESTLESCKSSLEKIRYRHSRFAYMEWVKQLPSEGARALAEVHWTAHEMNCEKIKSVYHVERELFSDESPLYTHYKNRCYSCYGPWQMPFNAVNVMKVIMDDFDLEWQFQCIGENMPRRRRSKEMRTFISLHFGKDSTKAAIYSNATMIEEYETVHRRRSTYDLLPEFARPTFRSNAEITDNLTLTEDQACSLIEQFLCGEDCAVVEFSRPVYNYAYEIAPDHPFPNSVDIWNTFAFRNIGNTTNIDSLEDSFYRNFVNNRMLCYQELRYEYEGWAGRLPTIESQAVAMLQWHIYALRFDRQHKENLSTMKRMGVNESVQNAYLDIYRRCMSAEADKITLQKAEIYWKNYNINGTKFPLYFNQ